MFLGSIRLDEPSHRPRRYFVSLFLPLFALFCCLKFAQLRSTRHLAVSRARQLLNPRLYSGLNPDYYASLNLSDVRPAPGYEHVPQDARTYDMDFRDVRVVEGLTLLSRVSAGLTTSYIGDSCLSHYPGQLCPVPGSCPSGRSGNQTLQKILLEKGQCLHWARGSLPLPPPIMSADQVRKQRTRLRHSLAFDRKGSWQGHEWKPEQPGEKYRFFTPEDMHKCLAGKRIYVQGDSLMRQIYHRIISYSRMIPASIEHYHGIPSSYTVYIDGTDRWDLPRADSTASYSRDLDEREGVLYRVFYDWYPEEQLELSKLFRPLIDLDVDVAMLGMNYWYPVNFDFSRMPKFLDDFWQDTNWQGVISWYATPQEFQGEDSWFHVGQNALMRHFINDRSARTGKRIQMIPVDRITIDADNRGQPRRNCRHETEPDSKNECMHDAHFGCGYLNLYDTPVAAGLDGMKAPLGYDCRDIFNFAILQNWLNAICVPE